MGCHRYAAIDFQGGWTIGHGLTGVVALPQGRHSVDFDFSITLEAACLDRHPDDLSIPCVQALELLSDRPAADRSSPK